MKTAWDLALVVVGLASIAGGVALGWFAIWLGGLTEDLVWPFQLGVLAFALLFALGGAAAVRAGLKSN